ncbi:MAG: geranylgeranylglyceryl/heptaprenylglyceryl phosphate synthase, partial [Candidatus Bathyarchaeia archaeon]
MVGVESYLVERIRKEGAIHISLLDPENLEPEDVKLIASEAEALETSAIMVGGTTLASVDHLNAVVKSIKASVKIPLILFP